MSFSVTVIGSNSAIPAHGRHPSAQILTINEKLYMIDCGEGTQMRLFDLGIRWMKVNQIFITHLHGDHYFGLIGILSTCHLLKRTRPLDVFGPAALLQIIQIQLEAGQTTLCYELNFHALDGNEAKQIFENEDITVETILLKHRIDCTGFLFKEKQRNRKIIKEKITSYKIPLELLPDLKKGYDIVDEETGATIPNSELTTDPLRARSYAYCCDTAYNESMIEQIRHVDLLYHDCTFDEANKQRAEDTFHSTTKQAAEIAKLAGVKQLMIGHFSSKYDDLYPLLDEAREVFEDTLLALEGKTYDVLR